MYCALHVWDARRACNDATLQGGICDQDGLNSVISQIRSAALAQVPQACSELQVQNLRFMDLFEAQSDVIRFCRDLDTAVRTAVYGPDPAAVSLGNHCELALSRVAGKLLRVGFRSRSHTLDRMAAGAFRLATKMQMLARSTQQIETTVAQLVGEVTGSCPAATFEQLYGRSVEDVLQEIASRSDCLAGNTYVQGIILCPASVCGNGMQEPGEFCDDGNTEDGDGCSSTCSGP
jgi:cysteine-rich repeat protein